LSKCRSGEEGSYEESDQHIHGASPGRIECLDETIKCG